MRGSPSCQSSSVGFMENPSMYVVPSPTRLASNTEATARAKARASTTSPSNSIAMFLMSSEYPVPSSATLTGDGHQNIRCQGLLVLLSIQRTRMAESDHRYQLAYLTHTRPPPAHSAHLR